MSTARPSNQPRVLITGGGGLLGQALCRMAPADVDCEVTVRSTPGPEGVKQHRVDLAQPLAAFELIERRRPSLVIHTAYSTQDLGRDVVDAASEVAAACATCEVDLIHVSTDAVFDGEHAPYAETDPPAPIHPYGRAKALAEAAVRIAHPSAAIIRTSLLINLDPPDNTSRWVLDALRSGERPMLFSDELRSPLFVDDLATAIWKLSALNSGQRCGVWHLGGARPMSRVDIGVWLCEQYGLDASLIRRAKSADLPEPRPRDLQLSCERALQCGIEIAGIG